MAKPKKQKPAADQADADFSITVEPRSPGQQMVMDLWPRSRILFLLGAAGVGKSHIALALATAEILSMPKKERGKLMLSRPMVTCDEPIGFLPGDLTEKTLPWLSPFQDVFGQMSFAKWESLAAELELEMVPVGMLRGRTVRNGVLVLDEGQSLTPAQLKCALSRIGTGGRIVICGDPDQSDRYPPNKCPLVDTAKRLEKLDTVSVVRFHPVRDQLRDPLVSEILELLP